MASSSSIPTSPDVWPAGWPPANPHVPGTTREIVEKLIAGNERAELAWDRAVRGEHGGAHNPHRDPATGRLAAKQSADLKLYNIQVEGKAPARKPDAPTGTSANAGLRRLDKAAQGGDRKAAELLRRVTDKAATKPLSVHSACVAMGWRKPTRTSSASNALAQWRHHCQRIA